MREIVKKFPSKPGIYIFKNKKGAVLYIGKSVNLKTRVRSYFSDKSAKKDKKIKNLLAGAVKIDYQTTETEFDALILEANLIRNFKPRYNNRLKDDKHYLYIRITNEKYPKVTTSRKQINENKSFFFGPYPSSRTVNDVLSVIRRIFPFCAQKISAKRKCFYSHINLCNPCPFEIEKAGAREKKRLQKKYNSNIKNIMLLLSGKRKKVENQLKKEMNIFSKNLEYEQANKTKKKLEKLIYVTKHRYSTSYPYSGKAGQMERIEGYDISNIQGQQAVGAMVVFEYGEPIKRKYRKFKIKGASRPNDPAMLKEIILRRLNHLEWTFPNLILIDGGKPQTAAAQSALKRKNVTIPIIGLAKKNETIVLKYNEKFKELNLEKSSKMLKLLQEIRDEAHRFANTYHKLLRKKHTLK